MADRPRIQLELTPNDKEVSVSWRVQGRPVDRTSVRSADLVDCTSRIRKTLNELNAYVRNNILLSSELDDEFKTYYEILDRLKQNGGDLHNLLTPKSTPARPRSSIEQFIEDLPVNSSLDVYVEDESVTIPLGFAFDGRAMQRRLKPSVDDLKPSVDDFAGFWLSKFSITTWLGGVSFSAEPQEIQSTNFRALFAVDRQEWDDAWNDLLGSFPDFAPLFELPCGVHNTWEEARHVWETMTPFDSLFFLFGHSDGHNVKLSGDERPSYHVKNFFSKCGSPTANIVIANACMSLAGNPEGGSSILSLAADGGFISLMGAEAQILNTKALSCGARVLYGLCVEGVSFGDAFDQMRNDARLFPLNLFYSCYGDRTFRLDKPLPANYGPA